MKGKKLLVFVAFIFIFLVFRLSAVAFEVNKTSSGAEIKWISSQATYKINGTDGPVNALQSLQAAMKTWTDVSTSIFSFYYGGTSTSSAHGIYDGVNLINFAAMGQNGVLAENTYWFSPVSGQLLDSDIQFNTSYLWSTDGSPGFYDIQNVGTHELGHSLSLKDLYDAADSEKTMYGYAAAGETKKRTLAQDDINGVVYLYPGTLPVSSLLMVVRAFDDSIWASSFNTSGLFNDDWVSLPGRTPSSPALMWNPAANKILMVVRASDDTLWTSSFDSSGTFNNNWNSVPGMTPSAPALVWNPVANKMQMVVRAYDDSLWVASFNSSGLFNNDWLPIPGATPSSPALAWNPFANEMQMVIKAFDDTLWSASFDPSGAFNDSWVALLGATPTSPALTVLE